MSKYVKVIVLADSFEQRFLPITEETPKVLFPLVNEVVIEYTLSWLQTFDFKDIFVVYKNRKDKIQQHFLKSKRQVQLIHVPDANTVGDALREIYNLQIIDSDFILVNADTVCNINLQSALDFHFENIKDNKSNIMTSIVRKRSTALAHLTAEEDFFLYTVDSSMKLLQLDNLNNKFNVRFNNERTKMEKGQYQNVTVHSDFVDCEIYICSYDVLKAFQENLLNNFRDDFMREILTSEITEERFHIHVVPQTEMAVRIRSPRLYYYVSQALLQGIFKPFTPNSSHLKSRYNYEDLFKYFGHKAKYHHSAIISNSSAIGPNSQVGPGVQIINSVIGKNCQIGDNCVVKNSILWDGVILHNSVTINDSILASNVIVGANTIIERGCLLSDKVEIKSGVKIPELSRIGISNGEQSHSENYCVKGTLYSGEKDDPSKNMGFGQNYFDSLCQEKVQLGQSLSDECQQPQRFLKQQKKDSFSDEIKILIQECIDDPSAIEQAILAIEIMKLNDNKTLVNCINAFTPEILQVLALDLQQSPQDQLAMMKKTFGIWKVFLQKFVTGKDESEALIFQLEDFCRREDKFTNCLHLFYQLTFQNEILTGEQILDWAEKTQLKSDTVSIQFMKINATFIGWLKEQNQEDEEEGDEIDDEEETDEDEEEKDQ